MKEDIVYIKAKGLPIYAYRKKKDEFTLIHTESGGTARVTLYKKGAHVHTFSSARTPEEYCEKNKGFTIITKE